MARAIGVLRDVDAVILYATDMKCPECGKQYRYRGWLRRHYVHMHTNLPW